MTTPVLLPTRIVQRATMLVSMAATGAHPYLSPRNLRRLVRTHLDLLLQAHPDLESVLPRLAERAALDTPRSPAWVLRMCTEGRRGTIPVIEPGPYRVVVADPAWRFGDALRMQPVKRGADDQYRGTMDNTDIAFLPVELLAEDDAVLGLWTPAAMLGTGLAVMERWGFRQVQIWDWIKTGKFEERIEMDEIPEDLETAFGMGRLARGTKEHLLVGVRGRVYRHLCNRSQRDTFFAPNPGHSKKPEKVQDALDLMFPEGNRLELFARRQRRGWTCLGNEAPATLGEDLRDSVFGLVPEVQCSADQVGMFGG